MLSEAHPHRLDHLVTFRIVEAFVQLIELLWEASVSSHQLGALQILEWQETHSNLVVHQIQYPSVKGCVVSVDTFTVFQDVINLLRV